MKKVILNKNEITSLIPHREPLLFLDEVTVESHNKGSSISRWKRTHPVFKGHFPGFSIVPGIFMIEAAAQLASVISAFQLKKMMEGGNKELEGKEPDEYVGVLSGIRKSLIHKPVFPDQDVLIEIRIQKPFKRALMGTGKGYIDSEKACTFELMFAIASKDELSTIYSV